MGSAKEVIVKLIGDSKSLEDALKKASREAETFAGVSAKTRERVGLAGVALGGVLVTGLVGAAKAAVEGQISQEKLDQALRNTHQSVRDMTPALEEAQKAALNMGFSDDSARESLARLETATGSTSKSTADLGVAMDVARFKHVSLDAATKLLTGSMAGQTRAAKALGINVEPVTTNYDALKKKYKELGEAIPPAEAAQAKLLDKQATGEAVIQAVTDKVHGQAKAYSKTAAGSAEVFRVKMDDLQEQLGTALLPALTTVTGALSGMATWLSNNTGAAKAIFIALGALSGAMIAVGFATKAYNAILVIVKAAQAVFTGGVWLLNAALDANPIGIVVLALAGLGLAFVALWQKSQTFRDIVKGVWAVVEQVFATAKAIITGHASGMIGVLANIVVPIHAIKSAADAAASAISYLMSIGSRAKGSAIVPPSIGGSGLAQGPSSGGVPTAPNATYQAAGVYNFPGGLTWVGEMGPELVQLPAGANVYSNGQSARKGGLGGGGGVHVTVHGFVGSEAQLASKIRDTLVNLGRQEPGLFGGLA